MATLLVVEDEALLGRTMAASLAEDGHDVHHCENGESALTWLEQHQARLAVVDLRLPGIDGLEVLQAIRVAHPDVAVIMMTAYGDVQTAVAAMKAGAADFLIKPLDLEALALVVTKTIEQSRVSESWRHEQKSKAQKFGLHRIIGECPLIEKARSLVRRMSSLEVSAAQRPPNILITGETGTGKDVFAKAFHYEGVRRHRAFVHVNCAALPESLLESELFGHAQGAFTDARSSKRGLFDVADQGTLFLDEIGSMPIALQAKVLTAIETGRFRPVGGSQERSVDLQIIAAMNQDPRKLIQDGRFREDLYHRLRVIHVDLPPLRERGNDVVLLAEHFLEEICRRFSMPKKPLTESVAGLIRRYAWPGNVRELYHRLESAVLLSSDRLEMEHLPGTNGTAVKSGGNGNSLSIPVDFSKGPVSLESVEKALIRSALIASASNVSRAADMLAISRDTLRYRLEKHGIQPRAMEKA